MGQVLHRSATTTEAIRRAIQHSQESMRALARRHGINPKTVAKWKKRESTADRRTGPTVPRSTVLSVEQEAIIVAFRKHTLLPLDDCLYTLQATIPPLTRSSLHRCLERHGISRLPEVEGDKLHKKKFDTYPIGFFHIDLAEVRTAEGKLYLFVAIDRTSKFAVVELVEKADMRTAAAFLEALVEEVPYHIHTVLTDNGIQFADLPKNRQGPTARFRGHPFNRICHIHGIEHRLTKPSHPWTNGQVERMNPNHQRGHRPALPLLQPQPAANTPRRLHRRLRQFRDGSFGTDEVTPPAQLLSRNSPAGAMTRWFETNESMSTGPPERKCGGAQMRRQHVCCRGTERKAQCKPCCKAA